MKTVRFSTLTVASLMLFSATAFAQQPRDQIEAGIGDNGLPLGQSRPMTAVIARQLVAAAIKASCAPPSVSCSGAFAVVDDAGVLVNLDTVDGVLAGGPELAIRKARTAALWRRPTTVFKDAVDNKSNSSYADGTFPDMTTSPGGIPLFGKDGRIVGGFACAAVGHATKQALEAVNAEAARLFGGKK